MSDLIRRADAMAEFREYVKRANENGETPTWNDAVSLIGSLPSADAIQGEWIDENGNNVPLHKDGYPLRCCYCNQCHEWLVASDEYEVKGNFCPNCGARMKGGDDE